MLEKMKARRQMETAWKDHMAASRIYVKIVADTNGTVRVIHQHHKVSGHTFHTYFTVLILLKKSDKRKIWTVWDCCYVWDSKACSSFLIPLFFSPDPVYVLHEVWSDMLLTGGTACRHRQSWLITMLYMIAGEVLVIVSGLMGVYSGWVPVCVSGLSAWCYRFQL